MACLRAAWELALPLPLLLKDEAIVEPAEVNDSASASLRGRSLEPAWLSKAAFAGGAAALERTARSSGDASANEVRLSKAFSGCTENRAGPAAVVWIKGGCDSGD